MHLRSISVDQFRFVVEQSVHRLQILHLEERHHFEQHSFLSSIKSLSKKYLTHLNKMCLRFVFSMYDQLYSVIYFFSSLALYFSIIFQTYIDKYLNIMTFHYIFLHQQLLNETFLNTHSMTKIFYFDLLYNLLNFVSYFTITLYKSIKITKIREKRSQ